MKGHTMGFIVVVLVSGLLLLLALGLAIFLEERMDHESDTRHCKHRAEEPERELARHRHRLIR